MNSEEMAFEADGAVWIKVQLLIGAGRFKCSPPSQGGVQPQSVSPKGSTPIRFSCYGGVNCLKEQLVKGGETVTEEV